MTAQKTTRIQKVAALILFLAQAMHLHSIPTLSSIAAQTGQKTRALLPENQDKRTIVLAAGTAAATWIALSSLNALWNHWCTHSSRNRLSQLEQRLDTGQYAQSVATLQKKTQEFADTVSTLKLAVRRLQEQAVGLGSGLTVATTDVIQLQCLVASLRQEVPFWGKLNQAIKDEAVKLHKTPPTTEQVATALITITAPPPA